MRGKNTFLFPFFVFIMLMSISCAGGGKGEMLSDYSSNGMSLINIKQVNLEKLLKKITELDIKINSFNGDFKSSEYKEIITGLEEATEQYKSYMDREKFADYENGKYLVPPMTELSVEVDSFCLDPGKAVPAENEPYVLVNGDPDIPMFNEIMKATNTRIKADKNVKQNLLWNLKNNVRFEFLSEKEKELLLEIDPLAYLKINSYLKDAAAGYLKSMIPGLAQAEGVADFVKGTAYKYEEYTSVLRRAVSSESLPDVMGPVKADGYDLFTLVKADGYSKIKLTFINMTEDEIQVNSFLNPFRMDVQPLAFDLPVKPDDEWKKKLKASFGKLAADSVEKIQKMKKRNLAEGDRKTIEDNPEMIVDIWKANEDQKKAFEMTEKFCKENPDLCSKQRHNCMGDAFRHALWNALMERDVDEFAVEIANNHELNPGPVEEKEMDLFNNEKGREIGRLLHDEGIKDDEAYYKAVIDAVESLKTLK